jgi:hypothetical protein
MDTWQVTSAWHTSLLAVQRFAQTGVRLALRNEDGTVYIGAINDTMANNICSLDEYAVQERLHVLDIPLVNDQQLDAMLLSPS